MRNDIDAFERRTKNFAIGAIRLCARRSRSTREFAAKLQIVNEEIDESVLWLEIADEIVPEFRPKVTPLLTEGLELRSMFAKARSTTRQRLA